MASSTMRLSGLISGMDTESIIQQLVSAKQTKVDEKGTDQTGMEADRMERAEYQD